jgi:uncharacterized protein YdaL
MAGSSAGLLRTSVMNFRIHSNTRNCLTTWATINFSRKVKEQVSLCTQYSTVQYTVIVRKWPGTKYFCFKAGVRTQQELYREANEHESMQSVKNE